MLGWSLDSYSKVAPRFKKGVWRLGLVATLYLLIAIAVTYPVAFRLSSQLAGTEAKDAFEHIWMLWWAKKALVDLHTNPANSSFLHYPLQVYHPMLAVEPYTKLVAIPLVMAFGPLVAYNLHFLATFMLAGLSMYLLCYYLTRSSPASFLGGLIFAFFPSQMTHATMTFIQIIIYWYPLYALSLFLLLKRPTIGRAFLCGVLLALASLVGLMHLAYFVIPFTLLFFLYNFWANREKLLTPLFLRCLGVVLGTAFLLVAPFFLPFLLTGLSGGLTYLGRGGTIRYSADLWSFLLPSPFHPFLGRIEPLHSWAMRAMESYRGSFLENVQYIGFVPLLLSLIAIARVPKKARMWVILGLGAAILALGPLLKVGGELFVYRVSGEESYVVLPYALVKSLPLYKFGRTPARLGYTLIFSVAILASYGIGWLLDGVRRVGWQVSLAGCLALLILFEYLVIFPFPTGGGMVPSFYKEIAQDSEDYAILDLPLLNRWTDHYATYYQTIHQHRVVGGYIYRVPLRAQMMLGFLAGLLDPLAGPDIVGSVGDEERLAVLNYSDIRYVVAHRWVMARQEEGREEAMVSFLRRFLGEPLYEDEKIVVFGVPGASLEGRHLVLPPLLVVGDFWYEKEEPGGIPTRWMGKEAVLYLVAPVGKRYRLAFSALSFHQPRDLKVWVEDQEVGGFAIEEAARDLLTEEFSLREGWSVVRFEAQEPCQKPSEVIPGSSDGRCLSLLLQGVRLVPVDEEGS